MFLCGYYKSNKSMEIINIILTITMSAMIFLGFVAIAIILLHREDVCSNCGSMNIEGHIDGSVWCRECENRIYGPKGF